MAEQQGDLIDRDTGKKHLHGKRVAEHVGVAAFFLTVGLFYVGQFEQTAIASLPVCYCALWIAIAAPEEVAGTRLGAGRNAFERLHDVRGERHVDRCPGLCLIEQKAIAI